MATQKVIAPDGKPWYVPIPPGRDRAVFCRPHGTTWQLYRFAEGAKGLVSILAAINVEYGDIETAVVMLDPEESPVRESTAAHELYDTIVCRAEGQGLLNAPSCRSREPAR